MNKATKLLVKHGSTDITMIAKLLLISWRSWIFRYLALHGRLDIIDKFLDIYQDQEGYKRDIIDCSLLGAAEKGDITLVKLFIPKELIILLEQ